MNTIRKTRQIKARNDKGVGVIGLVVTLVILSIIAAIGGPPLWRLITDANEAKLNSHLEQAAEAVKTRFRLKPELLTPKTATTGTMTDELRNDLTAEWGVPWLDWPGNTGSATNWTEAALKTAAGGASQDQTFFLQAINVPADRTKPSSHGKTNAGAAAANAAPQYPFIVAAGSAWRIAVANEDGAWACALIVQRPKVTATNVAAAGNYVGGVPSTTGDAVTSVTAWMVGDWFDRGDRLLDNDGMNSVCSPVIAAGTAATTAKMHAALPTGVAKWPVGTSAAVTGAHFPDVALGDKANIAADAVWRTLKDRL